MKRTRGDECEPKHNTLATHIKIEYHAVGETWWQPLLSYGKWVELKIGSFIY